MAVKLKRCLITIGAADPVILHEHFRPHWSSPARGLNIFDCCQVNLLTASTTQSRILVADDDESVRYIIERTLTREGYSVDTASWGDEAARLVRSNSYDVVISDINMPAMSGITLLNVIRDVDLDLPVILITGLPSIETAIQAVEYGAFRYLTKPVSPEAVNDAVRYAINIHRLARVKREALAIIGANPHMAGDRAGLTASLERAVASMWMVFQPIISWKSKSIFAHEALMRSKEESLPHPPAVIDAAEKVGRLHHVSRRVRELTAQVLPFLPDDQCIFINIDPQDLFDETLFSTTTPLVQQASRVALEITERANLDDLGNIQERLALLRKQGFRLVVDDLGTGYAGLQTFVQLKPELAKVDMSLVRNIDRDPTRQKVVQSMLELCSSLNIPCITEGVENSGELNTLIDMGADLFQGYVFSKPGAPFVELTPEDIRRAAVIDNLYHHQAHTVLH